MSSKFTAGDVVALKSGGPTLTVKEIENNECLCEWFIGGDLKSAWFADVTIELKKVQQLGLGAG